MTRTGLNWPFWMHILVGRLKLKNWGLWRTHASLHGLCLFSASCFLCHLTDPLRLFQCGFQHHLNHSYAKIGAPQVAIVVKNPPNNAGNIRDEGLTPRSGRSCLENSMDRGAWQSMGSMGSSDWAHPYFKILTQKETKTWLLTGWGLRISMCNLSCNQDFDSF